MTGGPKSLFQPATLAWSTRPLEGVQNMYLPNDLGQGLVEYALILVLVAIVVIAILLLVGPRIANIFSKVTNGLSGT